MRIRQIKPEWWLDKQLRRGTTAEQREVYVGLWMIADDDGWLTWDVERIAAELFPFDSPARRERLVRVAAERLQALDPDDPHLVLLDCGHARVPKLVRHQRFGGRPVYTVRDAHARGCAPMRADARESSQMPQDARPGRVGNGRVLEARDAQNENSDGRDSYGELVAQVMARRLGFRAP